MGATPEERLDAISAVIADLSTLQSRTAAPAPVPHQYVGTVIDNTVALLTAPANSLDGGHRSVRFIEDSGWRSLMQAVHRSFFASVHLALERAIVYRCQERGIAVNSQMAARSLADLALITRATALDGTATKAHARLLRQFERLRPSFDDYLNAVLDASTLPKAAKVKWRRFFAALTILRNKASHSLVAPTPGELQTLVSSGFFEAVGLSRDVGTPREYMRVATLTLGFGPQSVGRSRRRD